MTAPYPPRSDVGEILVSADDIQRRVAELGAQITSDLSGRTPLLIGVLKGTARLQLLAGLLLAGGILIR